MVADGYDRLCRVAGVARHYRDGAGADRTAPVDTLAAVLQAMGLTAQSDEEADRTAAALEAERSARLLPPWLVLDATQPVSISIRSSGGSHRWTLAPEDGAETSGITSDPVLNLGSLPPGRHHLTLDGESCTLIVAPPSLPAPPRSWGMTAPLYGLRPPARGGIGDYRDLARLAETAGRAGASFLGINPVHAGFPEDPLNYSPYSPSSRRFLNILHVAAGQDSAPPDGPLIDYPAAIAARRRDLEAAWTAFEQAGNKAALDAFCRLEGPALQRFALHQALSEVHGPYWPDWPPEFQRPDSAAVAAFQASHAGRIAFHCWAQWIADSQLGAAQTAARDAGMRHGLYLDLAVGTHPRGAERWADSELYPDGVTLGAPPDAFSPTGQDWGISPLQPRQLAATGFQALAETLRRQLRHAGILRIDHVLGFDRAFWCPEGLEGCYVAMPKDAMLAVARIEAARAGGVIVGEDLGNVPEGLRRDLDDSGLLGCCVAMFERDWHHDGAFTPPEAYRERALASLSTHDLPSWAGWRSASDIAWREKTGQMSGEEAASASAHRRDEVAAFDAVAGGDAPPVEAAHRHLARTASRLVAVQVEDVLELTEQANLPGTIFEHPNWRRRLPCGPSELGDDPRLARLSAIMKDNKR